MARANSQGDRFEEAAKIYLEYVAADREAKRARERSDAVQRRLALALEKVQDLPATCIVVRGVAFVRESACEGRVGVHLVENSPENRAVKNPRP